MDVTVIIPTILADEAMLERCLTQVRATTDDSVEIIVPQGGSFAVNCNEGSRKASGDVLVFLNDDTLPRLDWLEPLVDALEDGAHVAGSRLIYPDGTIQHAGVYFRIVDGILTAYNYLEERPSGEVDAVTGACLAIRAEDFATLDGFDEGFVNGYEDVDLCLRVKAHGGRIAYCADSTIIHYESRSPGRFAHAPQNVQRLQERWSWKSPTLN